MSISKRVLRKFRNEVKNAKKPATLEDVLNVFDDLEGYIEGDYDDICAISDAQKFIARMYAFGGCHKYIVHIDPDEDDTPLQRWVCITEEDDNGDLVRHCECPACGETATAGRSGYFDNETPFCPWCGTALAESGEYEL